MAEDDDPDDDVDDDDDDNDDDAQMLLPYNPYSTQSIVSHEANVSKREAIQPFGLFAPTSSRRSSESAKMRSSVSDRTIADERRSEITQRRTRTFR